MPRHWRRGGQAETIGDRLVEIDGDATDASRDGGHLPTHLVVIEFKSLDGISRYFSVTFQMFGQINVVIKSNLY